MAETFTNASLVHDPTKLRYVSIAEHHPKAKKIASMPGIDIFLTKQVLCIGQVGGQCILPIKPGPLDVVFKESFRHDHSELASLMSYVYGMGEGETVLVDEAIPLFPVWSTNFWHWIFESLPALLVMEKAGYRGQYIIPNLPFCRELVELFGIDEKRLLFPGNYYIIKNAIIPRLAHGKHLTHAPELVKLLRDNLLNAVGVLPGKKFAYIRREHTRRITNEEQVLKVLENFGFETFTPEIHPVKEQFRFMSNASLTVMPHGANLALTLTMPEYAALMECFSYALVDYCCLPTVNLLKMLYFAIPQAVGSGQINAATEASDWQNFEVDTDVLKVLLQNLLMRKDLNAL